MKKKNLENKALRKLSWAHFYSEFSVSFEKLKSVSSFWHSLCPWPLWRIQTRGTQIRHIAPEVLFPEKSFFESLQFSHEPPKNVDHSLSDRKPDREETTRSLKCDEWNSRHTWSPERDPHPTPTTEGEKCIHRPKKVQWKKKKQFLKHTLDPSELSVWRKTDNN